MLDDERPRTQFRHTNPRALDRSPAMFIFVGKPQSGLRSSLCLRLGKRADYRS